MLHLISHFVNFIGATMVTTGLIRRNCPWLLGLKISPCSVEGGDALDKKKTITPLPGTAISALHFSFPSVSGLLRPCKRPGNSWRGVGCAHRSGRGPRFRCAVLCGFWVLGDSFINELLLLTYTYTFKNCNLNKFIMYI